MVVFNRRTPTQSSLVRRQLLEIAMNILLTAFAVVYGIKGSLASDKAEKRSCYIWAGVSGAAAALAWVALFFHLPGPPT